MILLLNAAVMPGEGHYTLKQISASEFRTHFTGCRRIANNFRSYIGYPGTARLLEALTDVEIEVSREQATLAVGDVILIVKLRHRVADPSTKMTLEPTIDDFEFYYCEWKPLVEGEI